MNNREPLLLLLRRLKAPVRSGVTRMRSVRRLVRYSLRKSALWDGVHHPVFETFSGGLDESDGRFMLDFMGVRTDPSFRNSFAPTPVGPISLVPPRPNNVYFEYVFVLSAILQAVRAEFTAVELGAGYGFWLVTIARALAKIGSIRPVLIGVEMEDQRFVWMKQHFENNGLDERSHYLTRAAMGASDGRDLYVRRSECSHDYGLRTLALSRFVTDGPMRSVFKPDQGIVEVPRLSLATLLASHRWVDVLHMDIQGREWDVLRAGADVVDGKVANLFVATHRVRHHYRIRQLLRRRGWRIAYDFGPHSDVSTEYGEVIFVDGVIAAVNPRMGGFARVGPG